MTAAPVPPEVTPQVTVWFDPSCPWAWMTSRWIDEVARQRPLQVTWRLMCLAHLNEGTPVSTAFAEVLHRALGSARVMTAARLEHGRDVVKPLYDAIGSRVHLDGREDLDSLVGEALDEVGLPASLVKVAASDAVDLDLREEHDAAIALVGDDVGAPVVAVGDVAFFGPVVSPSPRGEDALRLFDAVVMAGSVEGFFELKRTRTRGPILT